MTNAQTEARAILAGLVIQFGSREGYDTAVNRLATALAAKDTELAKFDFEKHSLKVRLARAEAALAEARKAMKLAEQMMTKDSLCEAERLEEGLSVVRRALTGGKEE